MDLYLACFSIGFIGLLIMALMGLGHHGHDAHHDHGELGHMHGHHAHHADGGHHSVHGGHAHTHNGHHEAGESQAGAPPAGPWMSIWSLLSPRVLFSLCFGFGAIGLIAKPYVQAGLLVAIALVGAIIFEKALVTPVSNFFFRFESKPARTLESAICEEAVAVTNFDAQGHGLIAIDLDGRSIQVLGTLSAPERADGTRVAAGDKLFIQAVDAKRNSCTVSCFLPHLTD